MKNQIIIDCESDEGLPHVNVTGEIAGELIRTYLDKIEVTRLRVDHVDEPNLAPVN